MKRVFAAALLMIIVCAAFAACAQEDSRVFVFRDDAQRLWHSGGHYMYYGPDGNIRYEASIRMPKLVEEGTDPEVFYPAYCVDENVSTVVGTRYERLNIEDGSYYSQQQARIIRSILEKGYWPPQTPTQDYALLESMESRINAWLRQEYAGEETIPQISDLTGSEAMTATQGAIWHFANSGSFGNTSTVYGRTVPVSDSALDIVFDTVTVDPKESQGRDKHRNNIDYTYQYLINLEESDPGDIIWSFTGEQVILSRKWVRDGEDANADAPLWMEILEALLGGDFSELLENLWKDPDWSVEDADSGDYYYQTLVRFKLKGTPEGVKNLKLDAVLKDSEDKDARILQAKTYNVNKKYDESLGVLKPDSEGYYTVSFDFFVQEELSGNPHVELTLYGEQDVERGVYIYLPGEQPEDREVSQTLIGISSGLTRIDVESDVSFSLTSMRLRGRKYVDGLEPDASYKFELTDVTDPDNPKLISTAWNRDGSRFSFPSVQYTKPGVYRYKVTEAQVEGFIALDKSVYDVEIEVVTDNNGKLIVKCPVITKNGKSVSCIVFDNGRETELTIRKVWDLSHFEDPQEGLKYIPPMITVALYEEGKEVDRVTLSEDMDWTYTWEGLDSQKRYTVEEVDASGRFLSKTENVYNVIVLTNTVLDTDEQPDTGDGSKLMLWVTLAVLSAAAMLIIRRRARQ